MTKTGNTASVDLFASGLVKLNTSLLVVCAALLAGVAKCSLQELGPRFERDDLSRRPIDLVDIIGSEY